MDNNLKIWKFGVNNDQLVELVLSGEKVATTCIYDENDIPLIDEESILIYNDGRKACITKTKQIIITEFKNINEELALLEGEGNYECWKKSHKQYFTSIDSNFNEDTKVLFELFEVVKIFD